MSSRFCGIVLVTLVSLGWARGCMAAEENRSDRASGNLAVPAGEALLGRLKQGHPRLLVDAAGFDELRKRMAGDAALGEWDKEIMKQADRLLEAPLPRHVLPDGKRLLSTSRAVMDHTYTLALAYRLHGDERYRERLWRELKTVAEFPDFNPRHFLDTAEMTHALAIGYDWLFDHWTESERAVLRRAIVEMGLKPGLAVYRSGGGWPRAVHNWNQVCNGGMTIGAVAVADEEPKLAGEILHDAIQSVPRAMASYAPDGAWGEGPGYWNYATSYTVLMLAALRSALGSEFGLAELPGFSQTGLFPIYMTGPAGRAFNFADSSDRIGHTESLYWLARRFDLPVCAWFAARSGRPTARSLVWYQTSTVDPVAAGLPLDKYWRGVEVVTMRSDWKDPDAFFVGMQAGSNRVNHNHLDLGSFVLDALGQRWAVDLGGDDYNLPGYFGGQRYQYYRLRAEGHNTLVINPGQGPDQDPKADAKISRFESGKRRSLAIADLTPAYRSQASRVLRGVAMLDRKRVLVEDEVEAQQPVELCWFLHTRATVRLSEDGRVATLEQGGKRLQARLLAPDQARFELRAASPLASSPNPKGQHENGGVQKLTIQLKGVKAARLAVGLVPMADGAEAADGTWEEEVRPLEEWRGGE